ncbi:hypothetical protein CXB51_003659 [Gossypium anomalum]|uniref:Aminotransferase-like plant mobile domain-containing protein n=1 Tax=Gossypium anomalum TaxID=47600 RepID=A0A8J5ZHH7_9ROSI|nr:hypothetical protein CXB51_003659 [Gossypium anomalum]
MASGDPHISFAVRGVHNHSRGRCTTAAAPHRWERGQERKFDLQAKFEYLPSTATELEVMQAARAYIMHLIGGVLMPDTHDSEVHLLYLPLLSNLHNTHSYSWGSAVLAILYRELCRTTDPSAVNIGGCLILLQSWALYRMPFLASISHQSYIFPLVNRWSTNPGIGRSYTVLIYRLMIENHSGEGFIWMPYSVPEVTAVIPSYAHVHSHLWCISAPLIHFHTVEWYHGDRVLRRGRHGTDWGDEHSEYITIWNNRFSRVPQMDRCLDLQPSSQYLQWYYEKGKPFLFGGRSMVVPPHTTRIGQHLPDPHHAPAPEVDPEPEPELEPEPEPEPELHFWSSSYPPSYSAPPEPYPSPFSSPPGPYPASFSTPPGSSSSMAFESFSTPIHMDEENVDHRSRLQRERRAPRRYTPRTTPSNHQF